MSQPMNEQVKKLADEASKLSPDERAELVEGILESFDPIDPSNDTLWLAEAQDRVQAYQRGEITAVEMDEVLEKHWLRLTAK